MGDIFKGTTFVSKGAFKAPAKTEAPKTQAPAQTQAPAKAQAPKAQAVSVNTANFAGSYTEASQKVAKMEVTDLGNSEYSVHIEWAVNASEKNTWDLTGTMDSTGKLGYTNCRRTTIAYDKNGNYTIGVDGIQTPYTTYTAGKGDLQITSYGVVWTDTMGDIFKGTTFVK